jgi:hypothetical protein
METPQTSLGAQQGLRLGYGLGIRSSEYKKHIIFKHGGDADGYLSQIGYSHESKRWYVFSINAYRNDIKQTIQEQLDNWLVDSSMNQIPPINRYNSNDHLATPGPTKTKLLKRYTGRYESVVCRFSGQPLASIEVKLINEKLHRSSTDMRYWFELVHVNNNRFRDRGQVHASSIFVKDVDGALYLQGYYGSYKKSEQQ